VVDRGIHDDPIKPSVEARAALELVDVLMNLDERLLDGVQSVVLVLDDAHGDGKRPPMILLEQRSKSRRVSCLYALYQVMIALGGRGLSGLLRFGRAGQRLIHPRSSTFSRG
jgi:hypothetical protein